MPYSDPERRRAYQRKHYRDTRTEHHHGEKKILFQCRIPESIVARMRKMVDEALALGKFPYKSMATLTQALLISGMQSMKDDEFVAEMLPYLEAMQHIEQVRIYRSEAQSALSRLKTEVSEMLAIKAEREACAYYHGMLDQFRQLPPNLWSAWLVRETKRAFPGLLKATPGKFHILPTRRSSDRKDRGDA